MARRTTPIQIGIARACALLAICTAGLLGGCTRAPADGKVRITYWEKWTGAEAAALQATVDAFNRSQERIHVDMLTISGVDRKTILATAGGDPPDVAGIWDFNIVSWSDRNALMPLDDFIRAEGLSPEEFLDRYEDGYAAMCHYGGQVLAIPSAPSATALHWNKTLFREAGLDPEKPPRTIEELLEFSKRLTKRDPRTGALEQVGFLPQDPGWWYWGFQAWFGGRFVDENDAIAFGADPRNLEAFKWVEGYTDLYGVEELKIFASGFGLFGSPQYPFFAGKTAMVYQGVWLNNYMRQFAPGLDYGVCAWPAVRPGDEPFTVLGADMLAIPRGARHPKEAWEFLKYVASSNPSARTRDELLGIEFLCYEQEKNSPLRVWSPFFAERHPHPYIAEFRELARLPRATGIPMMGIWQEYAREINIATDRVRLKQARPEEVMPYVQERVERSWQRHRHGVELQKRAGGFDVSEATPAATGPSGADPGG